MGGTLVSEFIMAETSGFINTIPAVATKTSTFGAVYSTNYRPSGTYI